MGGVGGGQCSLGLGKGTLMADWQGEGPGARRGAGGPPGQVLASLTAPGN